MRRQARNSFRLGRDFGIVAVSIDVYEVAMSPFSRIACSGKVQSTIAGQHRHCGLSSMTTFQTWCQHTQITVAS